MGRKIDLSQKHDNSNIYNRKNTRPTLQNNNINDEEQNMYQDNNISNNIGITGRSYNSTEIKKELLKNPITRKIILVLFLISIVLLFIIYIIMVLSLDTDSYDNAHMAIQGYYNSQCQEVTVIFTNKSNNYEVTGTGTYELEDYVAGVVAGEVGFLGSIEVDKAFAIAARTYLLTHENNCTIESSDRKQVFRELTTSPTDLLANQAAQETAGQVLLSNNELYSVGYDAFCSIDVDDNYYTIKQANQKIPRNWVDSQRGIAESWKQGTCAGNHGRGLSQWGSFYLAKEQNYTYDQILDYYLKDYDVSISSGGFVSSITGLEIKNTTNASELNENLGMFLSKKGTSINDLNSFIKNNVKEAGSGSRAGVVTAAVSLINYLYDGGKVRIPYYWGGNYQTIGVNPDFGSKTSPSISRGGTAFYYSGFDCSGFASWAIRNGGYNFKRHTTNGFHNEFSSDSCDINNKSCIGQPGDLINSNGCHVQMIVSVDENSGKYFVAESTGDYGLIMREWNMHSGNCGTAETRIIHMDSFYNNSKNIDANY